MKIKVTISWLVFLAGWVVVATLIGINDIPANLLNVTLVIVGVLLTQLPIWIMTDWEHKPTPNK